VVSVWCLFIDNGEGEPPTLVDIYADEAKAKAESECGALLVEEWEVTE
jgi:hypothetical protein